MPKAKISGKPQNKQQTGKKRTISPITGADITATQFKPGQSGNPGGRPKSRPFKEALDRVLATGDYSIDDVVRSLVKEAMGGNVQAAKEIADRIEGKSIATVEVSGDPENPLTLHPTPATLTEWSKLINKLENK